MQKLPIQFSIQSTLITLALVLFFVIAFTTFYFLQQNIQELAYERQRYIAETVRKAIVEYEDLFNIKLANLSVNLLADLVERKQCDIDVYYEKGELMVSSIATSKNSPAQKR